MHRECREEWTADDVFPEDACASTIRGLCADVRASSIWTIKMCTYLAGPPAAAFFTLDQWETLCLFGVAHLVATAISLPLTVEARCRAGEERAVLEATLCRVLGSGFVDIMHLRQLLQTPEEYALLERLLGSSQEQMHRG